MEVAMANPQILLCTVGTGDVGKLNETLLEPLKKSIRKGEWERVILLPSQLTVENAGLLKVQLQDLPIIPRPLPRPGIEDDFDACFAHFDCVLEELRLAGANPKSILVDITRGTKAMSAALALAAINHDLPLIRYIFGKRDDRGMVKAGTEVVGEFRTTVATSRKRLDDAYRFFLHGNFAAVLDILPDPANFSVAFWPVELAATTGFARGLAAFYAAWDRLDYVTAQQTVLPPHGERPSRWSDLIPSPAVRGWVAALAEPVPEAPADCARHLRLLVADLLANGERRLRDHQFEDAVLRAYRVLELVGQIRLADQGLLSDSLPPDHPTVKKFQEELIKKNSTPLGEKEGKLVAAREQVARLLKRLGDPLATRMIELASEGVVTAKSRNNSALIHGFKATGGSDPQPLQTLYARLQQLLIDDSGPAALERLATARSLNFAMN